MSAYTINKALAQLQYEVSSCEQALNQLIRKKNMMTAKSEDKINNQLQSTPVAIVGMASLFPQAKNLEEYWSNIISKTDCITDVPPSRWDIAAYYDPDPKAADKTYCKRGGFIPDIEFNPMEFGLPPNVLEVTDVSQLLSLVVAKAAMTDAGYGETRQFNRERTGVILGVALARQLTMPLASRLQYPLWTKVLTSSGLSPQDTERIIAKLKLAYVKWEENAFPGMLANVVTGRIANRLDLGGMNCVVDAACASSLGALAMALSELTEHRSDMMLTGGVDTDNSIVAYMCFSKTPALSRSQTARPFDVNSDGMMLGEGIGMMVLKRLEDAERDQDRIYAVIKGIGTSSDGRYKSIYAPRPEGQVRALRRAYEHAGVPLESVSLIEAHGTGTMAGDPAEFTALTTAFSAHNPQLQQIALGSVKSQIGHTKAAAGAASLIKTALALHHKVLPATINVTQPHPKLQIESSPFYLNTQTRPWLRAAGDAPRRAGVSSFGFGGTNYHVVLEEYQREHHSAYRLHQTAESVLLSAPTPLELLSRCEDILRQLQSDDKQQHYFQLINECKSAELPHTNARVGFVVDSLTEAADKLQLCIDWLQHQPSAESWQHPQGIYYRQSGMQTAGKVVALFSGQGSQYLEMGRELVINFPCLRQTYGQMDSLLSQDSLKPLSDTVFPPPAFEPATRHAQAAALTSTEYAQPAIGVFSVGLYQILQQAGFKPDFVAGHSFGELTALWAAEVLSQSDYLFLAKARGQAMATPNQPDFDAGVMLAVKAEVGKIEDVVKNFPAVTIANWNSPHQVVLAGNKVAIAAVQQRLHELGYSAVLLPVAAAFHTPLVRHAHKPFAQALEAVTFNRAKIPVYTNISGSRYPSEPKAIQKILKEHLINAVLFQQEIENIYADGGYFFIEFGPRNILTNLVKDILGEQPHLAVALNTNRQNNSDLQLRSAVVQLRVVGLPLSNLDPYQLDQTPAARTNNLLSVRLNGVNHVSEKTKLAFETALNDGHQVKFIANEPEAIAVSQFIVPPSITNTVAQDRADPTLVTTPQVPNAKSQPKPEALNYQRVLESLEYSLAQFNHHQGEILQVHAESLKHQTDYAKTFFQLMQQQSCSLGGHVADSQAQLQSVLMESSERSMMRFHEHQGETLRIHEQYLNHQMEYAKNFFQLLQQQYDLLITGDSTEQPLSPPEAKLVINYQNSPAVFTALEIDTKQDNPQLLTTVSVAVPTNGHVASFHPASSNGSNKTEGTQVKEIDFATLSQMLLTVVSEKTGYPAEMLELEMDMEADLGIDSIKRVEILGTLQELVPELPKPNLEELAERRTLAQIVEYMQTIPKTYQFQSAPVMLNPTVDVLAIPAARQFDATPLNGGDPTPVAYGGKPSFSAGSRTGVAPQVGEPAHATGSPALDFDTLSQTLLAVVSEKTGYPIEMLELEMDMEADLGIDSIKRVEILGTLQELVPELPKPNLEELAELRTLGQIVEYLQQANSAETTMFQHESNCNQADRNHNILRGLVRLKTLPKPDFLDFTITDSLCLLTDDGLTTSSLAQSLSERGWKVVVLSFPQSLVAQHSPIPVGMTRVVLEDLSEEHLKQQLSAIAANHGSITAFIHLNPSTYDEQSQNIRYLETEAALLKQVFLCAKHLKQPLVEAAHQGRSCFITVAHLDGQFGTGQIRNFGAIGGGLFGLTKTLNQEWTDVFCRALDLSPELEPEQSVQYVLAEMHDPNRLITEVGYSSQGRTTLVCTPDNMNSVI